MNVSRSPISATANTFVHRWEADPVAALPEVFRMPVGQVGIVPFDAERLKRPHILRERPRATEPGVEVVDFLDGKHTAFDPNHHWSALAI
jgi:hypothetical protein